MKMRVIDIPSFIRPPHYCVMIPWRGIDRWIEACVEDAKQIPGALGIDLDPDFQRAHVWSEEKQIAFVEYCLRGGEYSKTILWNHPGWQGSFKGLMVLVDGKQRLEAVRKFVRNELPIFGGYKLNDFDKPASLLRKGEATFLFAVNNLPTRRNVLEWYLQLNAGGVVHTDEELKKVGILLANEIAKETSLKKSEVPPK